MSSPAQVRSIASIELFRLALLEFGHRMNEALVELNGQMQRAVDWIEQDQPSYWRQQTKNAEDAIHVAKMNLEHCLLNRVADRQPACRDQREELKMTKIRRDFCRAQTERVRHWRRTLKHEIFEYEGRIGQLKRILEQDIPKAVATLDKILLQLEAYQIEQAPEVERLESRVEVPPPNVESQQSNK